VSRAADDEDRTGTPEARPPDDEPTSSAAPHDGPPVPAALHPISQTAPTDEDLPWLLSIGSLVAGFVAAQLLDGGIAASLTIGMLFAVGAWLWSTSEVRRVGDLGQGLLVGAVVALAVLAVQRDADRRARLLDAERDRAQERQALRATLGLEDDLSNIDLSHQDLQRFVLVGKRLQDATLDHADLRRAVLARADLRRANAPAAKLDRAVLSGAQLQDAKLVRVTRVESGRGSVAQQTVESLSAPASVRWAFLDGADLSRADLRRVDLRNANLRRANLTDARVDRMRLDGADLRGARMCAIGISSASLVNAVFDSSTAWPVGFDPVAARAKQGAEASTKGGPDAQPSAYLRC
jgi:uncharacterized protein YjbI with pentapeptide repeats